MRSLSVRQRALFLSLLVIGSLVLGPATEAALQRVNVGVYGGLVKDVAAFSDGGTTRVFAALDGNRGIFLWQPAVTSWVSVTFPAVVGHAEEVEANLKTGYEDDLYAIIEGLDGQDRLFANGSGGVAGSWVSNAVISNPSVVKGHSSGVYVGTSEGALYLNGGSAADAFVQIHAFPREIVSIAPVDTNTIYVTLTFNSGQTNLFRLTRTNVYSYAEEEVPLPQQTPSGIGIVRPFQVGVDPNLTNRIILAGSDSSAGNAQVYESTDSGATWTRGWDGQSSGTNEFPGAFPGYVKFNSGRVFVSHCTLLDGTNMWTYPDKTRTTVGTASGTGTLVEANTSGSGLEVDPNDATKVYLSTDWAIGEMTCSVSAVWGGGTEVGANNGIEALLLNDMDCYALSPTSKILWVASKSGIGRPLHFDPHDPGSSATPLDWIFPLYPDGSPAQEITICPTNPAHVLAGYNSGRIFRSLNATGESSSAITWTEVFYCTNYPTVFDTDQNDARITAIDFVPGTPDEVYAGGYRWSPPVTNGGVFFSGDGGATWSNEASGYPVNDLYVSDSAVWAGVGSDESSARGLRVRQAPGNWWHPLSDTPMDNEIVNDIQGTTLDTTSTVYVATCGGVYKGVKVEPCALGFDCWTWTTQTTAIGSSDTNFVAVTLDPGDPDRAYVAAGNSIFETLDGGATWSLVPGTGVPTHEDVSVLLYDDLLSGTSDGLYEWLEPLYHYVDRNGTNPVPPYTNWQTAAVSIQDAVSVAASGEVVCVTNGLYDNGGVVQPGFALTNRVYITNEISVIAFNPDAGPATIAGAGPNGDAAVRCVYITNGGSVSGFIISNGHTRTTGDTMYEERGGGVFLDGSGTIEDCIIINNSAELYAGGVMCRNGGSVQTSEIRNNDSYRAGGVYLYQGGSVEDCVIEENNAYSEGGGVRIYSSGTVSQSEIRNNIVSYQGAGFYCNAGGLLEDCWIYANAGTSGISIGGGGYLISGGTLNNCEIYDNEVLTDGGGVYMQNGGCLNNCTIVGNSADADGGGMSEAGGGVYCLNGGTNRNCIIYFNKRWMDTIDSNWGTSGAGPAFDHCCTTPAAGGAGNTTNNPHLLDFAQTNFALTYGSPCVDAGANISEVLSTDLNGESRPVDGNFNSVADFDIGAYEYDPTASDSDGDEMPDDYEHGNLLNPTNAADAASDLDGDLFPNLSEYVAGTEATNAGSFLAVEADSFEVNPDEYVITWGSVAGHAYTLMRCTDLLEGAWTNLVEDVPATPTQNIYTDAAPPAAEQILYRVSVRQW